MNGKTWQKNIVFYNYYEVLNPQFEFRYLPKLKMYLGPWLKS